MCRSLFVSGHGKKDYASSLSAKLNLSCAVVERRLWIHRCQVPSQTQRWWRRCGSPATLRAFATMCFAAKWDTVVFTGSFDRTAGATSSASKQYSWKAPGAENRIVFDCCVAHAAVKFITRVQECAPFQAQWRCDGCPA